MCVYNWSFLKIDSWVINFRSFTWKNKFLCLLSYIWAKQHFPFAYSFRKFIEITNQHSIILNLVGQLPELMIKMKTGAIKYHSLELLLRKLGNKVTSVPEIPWVPSLYSRPSCHTLLNAFEISKKLAYFKWWIAVKISINIMDNSSVIWVQISKRVLQENKAGQIFQKTNISWSLIRTRNCRWIVWMYLAILWG